MMTPGFAGGIVAIEKGPQYGAEYNSVSPAGAPGLYTMGQLAKAKRDAEDEALRAQGQKFSPVSATSPFGGWFSKARSIYSKSGYNQAASAAAAMRDTNRGIGQYAGASGDWWRALKQLEQGYRNRKDSIQTQSGGTAALGGFMQGFSSMAGLFK